MSTSKSYTATCFCGKVEVNVTGEPVVMGYCHCDSCREWSAAPVNAFSIWKPDQVQVTRGADQIGTFNRTERSFRKWCRACGGHVYTDHPHMGVVDVYAGIIRGFPFKAALHVHYQEAFLRVKDGLPKMKDLPKDFGGSGEVMPE